MSLVTFRASHRRLEMYRIVVTGVCVFVCGRMPTLLHGPRCHLGEW